MRWFRLLAIRFARPEIEASQALDRERQARAALEITNASLQRENEYLRQQFETAINAERRSMHMIANIGLQSKYGITPYPDALGLPQGGEPQASEQTPTRPMQGVDLVRAANERFFAEYQRRKDAGEQLPYSLDELKQHMNSL